MKVVNPKVAKYDFRNFKIIQMLVEAVSHNENLIRQFWRLNIFYDFVSNRIRKCGKCCPLWTMDFKNGNGCDTMTQLLLSLL